MPDNRVEKEIVWKMTCRRLAEQLPGHVTEEWEDALTLLELSEDRAVVGCSSRYPAQAVTVYKEALADSLSWAAGRKLSVEIRSQETEAPEEKKSAAKAARGKKAKGRRPRGFAKFCLGTAVVVLFLGLIVLGKNVIDNQSFQETFYQVGTVKAPDSVRVVQLSDLHNTEYGKNNEQLVERLAALQPDLIVMTGDMIDRREESTSAVVELCRSAAGVAPTYYIYGNNETSRAFGAKDMNLESVDALLGCGEGSRDSGKFYILDDDFRTLLEGAGVKVLFNTKEELQVGETTIDLFGVVTSSPGAFWEYAGDAFSQYLTQNTDHLKLFLCHEPTIFEVYGSERWGDLILCGHTHGGVARLPYLGGLYVTSGGKHVLFPEMQSGIDYYVAGMYELNGSPLIVNTGLTNKGPVRVNNQPELVVVDINRY